MMPMQRGPVAFTQSLLLVGLVGMCFGMSDEYGRDVAPYGGGGASHDRQPFMMMHGGVLHEPQLSGRPLVLRILAEAASTPSAPAHHHRPWRSSQHGNMAWERLGWGW
ncbi:unnamed protein product [Bursaphelenchus xylophilus]|uniref:(pine wood nematode) hypothetical protein n=1 Tax=Bursaphelenchus xylophilus TaxID=6326 RepID=A0A1I7SAR7_BURXY|nr:unnamed protein product [Bursaphelenchus xylophilus]CAG9126850.1 unnamed protein product [Bursaphelenchus xylophilus]